LGIEEPFHLVILQPGSTEVLSETDRLELLPVATELTEDIRATGAEVAFYITHAYVPSDRRYQSKLIRAIKPAYISLGNALSALVIPVGIAFDKPLKKPLNAGPTFYCGNRLTSHTQACLELISRHASIIKVSMAIRLGHWLRLFR
jgi:hypothetical protein